jgi:hypothetical protein
MKEHTIITIMTAAGAAASYAIDILLAQEVFYEQFFGWGFQILLIISTQAMGFGMAGVLRRYLVWPAAMIWPATVGGFVSFDPGTHASAKAMSCRVSDLRLFGRHN